MTDGREHDVIEKKMKEKDKGLETGEALDGHSGLGICGECDLQAFAGLAEPLHASKHRHSVEEAESFVVLKGRDDGRKESGDGNRWASDSA